MAKKKETEFDKLARLVKSEGEDIRTELGGRIDGIGKEMRSGFNRMDQEFAAIRAELKSIRADIKELQEAVKEHESYTKEIDHILQRVVAIEKHLGIKRSVSTR